MKNHYQDMRAFNFQENGYAVLPSPSWLQLVPPDFESFKDSGWKFRLSVHPEDVEKAWNVVVDTLVSDAHPHVAKVAQPATIERLSQPENKQAGKMITIYTEENVPPAHYKAMMRQIEEKLKDAGIRQGLDVAGDRKVPGSSYISYRNDKSADGHYNAAANNANITLTRMHNPLKLPDPYDNFEIGLFTAPLGEWRHALTGNNQPITRIAVGNEDPAPILKNLQRAGFNPVIYESETLGMTVRLLGDDSLRMAKMQNDFCQTLRLQEWQEAATESGRQITRLPVSSDREAQTVCELLKNQGLKPTIHNSSTLGLTVRLQDQDVYKIGRIQTLEDMQAPSTKFLLALDAHKNAPKQSEPVNRQQKNTPQAKP